MTDLLRVLPHFPVGQFARLIPALEKHGISTSDLLTLEAADIGKRTHLPLLDIRRLCSAVLDALHADLGVADPAPRPNVREQQPRPGREAGPESDIPARAAPDPPDTHQTPTTALKSSAESLSAQWQTISTLDHELDRALGGGIPAGYVTEITGESGAGKTQFLLALLLSVQLPPQHGLGRPALYISTEAPLSTRRLAQMLSANPLYQRLPPSQRPSLDNIISTVTPDLESQDHILTFQVPVEVERRGIGLIVLDSVAANYRAEFERSASSSAGRHGSNMGARTAELVKLGMHLRELAQRHNLAVVVSNQVADRFSGSSSAGFAKTATPASFLRQHHHPGPRQTQESPLATRSRQPLASEPGPDPEPPSSVPLPSSQLQPQPPPPPTPFNPPSHSLQSSTDHPSVNLDHQQSWFTGWGDDPNPFSSAHPLKTPALGLVWTSQIAARIALFRRPALYRYRHHQSHSNRSSTQGGARGGPGSSWERHMKVVFAPHARETGPGLEGAVEFEVWMGGLRAVGGYSAAASEEGEDEGAENE